MTIYNTDDLKELLKISTKQAKALMRTEGFPSFKIGREYRVSEQRLNEWISSSPAVKLDYSKC